MCGNAWHAPTGTPGLRVPCQARAARHAGTWHFHHIPDVSPLAYPDPVNMSQNIWVRTEAKNILSKTFNIKH